MPLDNQPFARITPVDRRHANRVLHPWSLLCNFVVTQALGVLYGISCCLLPMMAGQFVADVIGAGFEATFGLVLLCTLGGAAAALTGLNLFGFPVLLIERRICKRFLHAHRGRAKAFLASSDHPPRVVELVPRERWKKRLCLDTAIDLMFIRIDHQGVWMDGDRCRYELPKESILGAECEGFRPPCCSFEIYMVTIYVRTADGTIELPISYRDYGWADIRSDHRRAEAMDLVDQINAAADGHLDRPLQWPTVADRDHQAAWQPSKNPYAAPALIDE